MDQETGYAFSLPRHAKVKTTTSQPLLAASIPKSLVAVDGVTDRGYYAQTASARCARRK
ncbi:hypothetical protein OH492_28200 [Vibrio chagasii]|nr:hypothetical protein [Vibrio chagasii]